MDSEEIDNFVRKSTILQETIAGIANGSIDENTVDLREYGILTYEQQKEDQERRAQTRKNFELEQAEREKKEREREKRQWWDGAVGIHGSPSNPTLGSEKVYDNSVEVRKSVILKDVYFLESNVSLGNWYYTRLKEYH